MKQRVVIAMALACNPELLLADEPTTALDVTIQAQVLEMIRELKEKLNTSMIMITHDLGMWRKFVMMWQLFMPDRSWNMDRKKVFLTILFTLTPLDCLARYRDLKRTWTG